MQPKLKDLEAASRIVHAFIPPIPQYCWPMLCDRIGSEVWVKHENHTPIGAFKIRGGLVYFDHLAKLDHRPEGVITATRGNHGSPLVFRHADTVFPLPWSSLTGTAGKKMLLCALLALN